MGKRNVTQPSHKGRNWRWAALGALILVAAGTTTFWGLSGSPYAVSGTPRLVVDRTDVDVGYRRFDAPVRVVFTLSNAGNGPLMVTEVPRVIVKAGC